MIVHVKLKIRKLYLSSLLSSRSNMTVKNQSTSLGANVSQPNVRYKREREEKVSEHACKRDVRYEE
jgi:hypothetical protein